MQETENVRTVLRGYDALNRGDVEAAAANMAADFEFTLPPMLPDYDAQSRGPEEFQRVWLAWRDQFEDFRLEIEETLDAGDGAGARDGGQPWDRKGQRRRGAQPELRPDLDAGEGVAGLRMLSLPNRAAAMGELGLGPKVDWE